MKQFKSFTIFLAMILMLSLAIPAFAQDTEEAEDDSIALVGTMTFIEGEDGEDGDIIFTDAETGDVYVIAPGGGFNPSALMENDPETLYQLEGTLLNEGSDDEPGTIRIGRDGTMEEFDPTTDTDGDDVPDIEDSCEGVVDSGVDEDADGIDDACDEVILAGDGDNDGVVDEEDNCPEVANPEQEDADANGTGDACEVVEDDEDTEEEDGDGGFFCRNRDVEQPAGSRIAEQYDVDYSEVIAQFCGDDGTHKVGWGLIRKALAQEAGESRGNANGNANGANNNAANANSNRGQGNGNGNGNGGNGNGNGGGNGGNNGRGR